jgi:hypothetical protein
MLCFSFADLRLSAQSLRVACLRLIANDLLIVPSVGTGIVAGSAKSSAGALVKLHLEA